MPNPRSPRLRLVPVLCAVGLACLGQPGESAAEEVRATSRAEIQRFDIPAGELAQVLLSIVRQSRTPIAFDQHLVEGLPAPAIQGSYSVEQALQRALRGSGLEYSRSAAGVLSLQRATAPDAALPATTISRFSSGFQAAARAGRAVQQSRAQAARKEGTERAYAVRMEDLWLSLLLWVERSVRSAPISVHSK